MGRVVIIPSRILGILKYFAVLMFIFVIIRYVMGLGLIFATLHDEGTYLLFKDVGQGSAVILYDKGSFFIIDGGPTNEFSILRSYALCNLNGLVFTHPHKDHLTGVTRLLLLCPPKTLYFNRTNYDSSAYLSFLELVGNYDSRGAFRGDLIEFGGFDIYVLWPPEGTWKENSINDQSIVFLVDYGSFEALLTADISKEVQSRLNLEAFSGVIQDELDVYFVPHHGSGDSFDEEYLAWLQPKVAVVSVGENTFGHPDSRFEKFFDEHDITYLRTDVHGDLKINLKETLQPQ